MTQLLQYALFCNGWKKGVSGSKYHPGRFDGVWTQATADALKAFQEFVELDPTGIATLDEWMALMVSYGNFNRPGAAIDCYTRLTDAHLEALSKKYKYVGRYLTGDVVIGGQRVAKNLLRPEMKRIFSHGLNLFLIFQDARQYMTENDTDDLYYYFTEARGYSDAEKAFCTAKTLGIPKDEIIYFAVDYDFMQAEVYARVVPYFKGINDYAKKEGKSFQIGIYSARNTCSIVAEEGYSISSFVSDMSSGYSGNMGYPLPEDWAFDQIDEFDIDTADGPLGIDKNVVSHRYLGINDFIKSEPDITDGFSANGEALILKPASASDIGVGVPVYWSKVLVDGKYVVRNPMFDYIWPDTCFNLQPSNSNGSARYVYFLDKGGRLNAGFIDMKDINNDARLSTYPFEQGHVMRDSETGESRIIVFPDPGPMDPPIEYTFITTAPVKIYYGDGKDKMTLPVNSRVTIASNCSTGASYPDRITAIQYMLPNGEGSIYEYIDADNGYGWVDLDLGLKPNDRRLISAWE